MIHLHLPTILDGEIILISPIKTPQGATQPPPGFQAPQEKKSDLEDLIRSYITSNEQKWTKQEVSNKTMEASLRNLEN